VIYSGIDTDFCGIWIVIALIFLLMGVLSVRERKHKNEMPRRFPVFVFTSAVLFTVTFLTLAYAIFLSGRQPVTDGLDYLIVEGDRVYDNGLSLILKLRLDKALDYKKENPATVLVLSGGTDEGDLFPEALVMYNYVVKQGIDESQILIEPKSETTAESIRFSLEKVEMDLKNRMIPPPVMVGFVTSDYHVLRTYLITRQEYGSLIYPVPAPSDPLLYPHQYVRECCALIKDYVVGNI